MASKTEAESHRRVCDESNLSLTQRLLECDESGYQRATQSKFLRLAANGKLSKDLLGQWLANDRLYINSYIRGIGRLISFLQLPDTAASSDSERDWPTKLLDWFVGALVNIRREEKFFVETAARYGIPIDLPTSDDGRVAPEAKLEGLRRWEALFESVGPGKGDRLPWLEAAVVYWGTEKCYLDAWSWAKSQLAVERDGQDEDGGAVRDAFIDNWTSSEFVAFVGELGHIIDEAVREEIKGLDVSVAKEFLARGRVKWTDILVAEERFWPNM